MAILFLMMANCFAGFSTTNKPFDITIVGVDCYLKIVKKDNQPKLIKSVSLTSNNKGELLSIDGFYLKDFYFPDDVKTLEIKENGDVFAYNNINAGKHIYTVSIYDSKGGSLARSSCIIKQGVLYKK
jgi:flagellar basal body rod protein FlgG